jgi:hypothetical protein
MEVNETVEHLISEHLSTADATIVCDSGVSGDDVITTMLATGLWKLSDEVTYCAGKRIRTLVPVEES